MKAKSVDNAAIAPSEKILASSGLTVEKAPEKAVVTMTLVPVMQPASASGDLHIHHAGGGATDIRGIDNAVCNLHQARGISLNGRFTFANFTLAPEDPRSAGVLEVQGSFLKSTHATFKTAVNEDATGIFVYIGFGAARTQISRTCWSKTRSPAQH